MDQLSIDLINWTNYFKGNQRKGVVRLRAILDEPTLYAKFKVDVAAMNAVIANFDKSSIDMMQQVYDSGLGDDLAEAYAAASGYASVDDLTSNGPTFVRLNVSMMSDSLADAIYADSAMSEAANNYGLDGVLRLQKNLFAALVNDPDKLEAWWSESNIWDKLASASGLIAENPSAYSALIGRQISFDIENYGTHTFTVVAVGHNELYAGGTAGLTFQSEGCIEEAPMNTSSTTANGWAGASDVRSSLEDIYSKFPDKVRSAISATKVYYNTASLSALSSCSDLLWLPSDKEVFGSSSCDSAGTQFAWYANGGSKAKCFGGDYSSDDPVGWWLRSVLSSTHFRIVSNNGSGTSSGATNYHCIAPCFCV